jgi:hypothetical protein
MRTRTQWSGGILIATLVAGSVVAFGAQTHEHGTAAPAAPAAPTATAAAPSAMPMPEQMKMMADMRARDAKLEALVKTMDGATGQAKIDTMATIIRELVQDEKAMHARMNDMRMQMMGPNHTGQ